MDSIKGFERTVQANIGLSKPRQTCLAAMVVGIVQARTVNSNQSDDFRFDNFRLMLTNRCLFSKRRR
jgi:hypothetical protein